MSEVGKMTVDQVMFRLCDRKLLMDRRREVVSVVDLPRTPDGLVRGRAEDGTVIHARMNTKSRARELIEEQARTRPKRRRRR